ncbi:mechanosensitive ion channel family protein [uncultured Sphingomonas sp.]|uniref:mechanosensitive ion channel family protein n=1 Tax=uncultured Sphingomonas sp. TaxID=158754 RepID=UPI0035CAE929
MRNVSTPPGHVDPHGVGDQLTALYQAATDWIVANWLEAIIATVAGIAIVILLHALRRLGRTLHRRDGDRAGWGTVFGRAIERTGNFFIVMAAAKLVAGYARPPAELGMTITFLFTIAAAFQAAIWARELILGTIDRRARGADQGETLGNAMGLIRLFVTLAVFAVALVLVLDNLGVNVTGLVAGLGVGGIAIGLAAQGIFADLFAALAIIFDRPFGKGDSIEYDGTSGSVEAIGLKSTRIRSFTGEERVIANKSLLDKEIRNNTLRNHRRGSFTIGLVYQTPPAVCGRIPALFKEIVEACGGTFVRAGFTGFGASSLDFEVIFDTDGADYAHFYDGRTAIGLAILTRFNADGIEFAYPTQTSLTYAADGKKAEPDAASVPDRDADATGS